jgi:hypothetical protein
VDGRGCEGLQFLLRDHLRLYFEHLLFEFGHNRDHQGHILGQLLCNWVFISRQTVFECRSINRSRELQLLVDLVSKRDQPQRRNNGVREELCKGLLDRSRPSLLSPLLPGDEALFNLFHRRGFHQLRRLCHLLHFLYELYDQSMDYGAECLLLDCFHHRGHRWRELI